MNESRRDFFKKTAAASVGLGLSSSFLSCRATPEATAASSQKPATPTPIWRNKQEGMHYRMLGRTGMMVSELVIGSYPFHDPKSFPVLDEQIRCGINYIDAASAYGKGKVEPNLGQYFKERGTRDQIFIATKLSNYFGTVATAFNKYEAGLSDAEKKELRDEADTLIAERRVLTPGYHYNYFGGQDQQVRRTYYRYVVLKSAGIKDDLKEEIKTYTRKLLNEALEKLQIDTIDVLFCPHGNAMPDLLEESVLPELFAEFKQQGWIKASAVSFHNDVENNLRKVIDVGYYDAAMFAYNIANYGGMEQLIRQANQAGVGTIAMKVARLFSMEDQPVWRREKLETAIPGTDLSIHAKAFMWALQNPNLSCAVSQMETLEHVKENVSIVGRKVDLQPV